MTNYLILILIGMAGVWVGYQLAIRKRKMDAKDREEEDEAKSAGVEIMGGGIVQARAEAKEENMQKVREFIEQKNSVTNDDVENLLGVSDATAERYLAELEKEGVIRQMGTGKGTYYEKP